jgi:hypothetical protein
MKWTIAIAVIIFLFPALAEAQVEADPPEGWIVFTSARYGNSDIFLMDTASGSLNRLTSDPAKDHRPAISADGSMVIFVSERNGQPDLYLIHLDEYGEPTGSIEQLTDDLWEEFDTDWCVDSHNYQFTVYRSPDTEAMELFYGSDMPDIEGEWDIYRYNPYMDSIDRMSLEPGDYRYPIYTADYGTVYSRRRWENPEDQFDILGYFHGALATRTFNFDHGIINGPIRLSSETVLFIPCTDGEEDYCIIYDLMDGSPLDSINILGQPFEYITPLNFGEGGRWFLAQAALSTGGSSEIVLFQGLGTPDPRILQLTRNDCYDGEPRWLSR